MRHNQNICDFLVAAARESNNKIIFGQQEKSYKELYDESKEIGKILDEYIGVKNIGIYLPNCIDFIESYFAVQMAVKVPVLISVLETEDSLARLIKDVDITLVITNSEYYHTAVQAISKVEHKCYVFVVDTKEISDNKKSQFAKSKLEDESKQIAAIIKTSGTSGIQKYVMLTHKGVIKNLEAHIKSVGFTKDDITLIQLPMCFGYCFSSQLLAHIYLQANIVINETPFDCRQLVDLVNKYKITNTTIVPSMLYVLALFLKKTRLTMNSLQSLLFGGMSVSLTTIQNLLISLKYTKLVETYGQTEHSPRITTKVFDPTHLTKSVGKPIEGVSIRIDDKTQEICVKSNCIMMGYYGNQMLTNETVIDGWLHTGDVGYMESGELYIIGRIKNILIRNGINISPEEIEETILEIAGVSKVVVYGKKDEVVGEIPIAVVELKQGYEEDDVRKQIISYCKKVLPLYKNPSMIVFSESIKTTYTGKVKRNEYY